MRDSSMKQLDTTPTAMGEITRLAYAHAGEKGVEVDLLLRKAGLTVPQINDPDARLEVRRQIKFLNLVAEVLNDDLLGFHLSQKISSETPLSSLMPAKSPLSRSEQRLILCDGTVTPDSCADSRSQILHRLCPFARRARCRSRLSLTISF